MHTLKLICIITKNKNKELYTCNTNGGKIYTRLKKIGHKSPGECTSE